jgi:hypothetical protein
MTWTVKGQGLKNLAMQNAIITMIEEKLPELLNGVK